MITNAVFLGSKKFGLNLFKALYEADPTIGWTILCPPDLNDMRTCFSEFQEYAKLKNLDLVTANSPAMIEERLNQDSFTKESTMFNCWVQRRDEIKDMVDKYLKMTQGATTFCVRPNYSFPKKCIIL